MGDRKVFDSKDYDGFYVVIGPNMILLDNKLLLEGPRFIHGTWPDFGSVGL